jgi:hypothetical protein
MQRRCSTTLSSSALVSKGANSPDQRLDTSPSFWPPRRPRELTGCPTKVNLTLRLEVSQLPFVVSYVSRYSHDVRSAVFGSLLPPV